VNAVAPGPVLTPFLPVPEDQLADFRRQREAAIPLGRLAETGDVVGPVLFLLGPDSGYVTGQVLHVNGGLLMP
jgi:NAD(P)-dependent dehydrogenase (short-subunit alcohol dehydrogenase family)